jgi:hypothetical protein
MKVQTFCQGLVRRVKERHKLAVVIGLAILASAVMIFSHPTPPTQTLSCFETK